MSTFRIPTFDELRTLFIDIIRSVIPEGCAIYQGGLRAQADYLSWRLAITRRGRWSLSG